MAIVLTTLILLDPNNQLAHIEDMTNLEVGMQYVVSGQYLSADTRITFQGFNDVALTKNPVGVPAPQTEVPCQISTVPLAAPVPPPAKYPYALKDRLLATNLNLDLSSNPGASPPVSAHGNATQGKLWLDTSVSPAMMRVCAVPLAQNGYVASDWATFGPISAGGGVIDLSGYMPLAGNSTKSGNLTVTGNLTAGSTTLAGLTVIGDLGVSGAQGITYSPFGGGGSDNSQHRYRFGWTGTNLVVSVDSTGGLQLANANQLGNYLPLNGGTLSGYLFINTGNNASIGATGEIQSNHSLATNGYVWINGVQWRNESGYMYTDSSVWSGASVRAESGGTAFYAPHGNLDIAGSLNFGGLQISNNGGWVYSGNGFHTSAAFQADQGGTALYLPNGNISMGGGIIVTGDLGGGLSIHATNAVEADHYGTAIYAPNGNVVCQSLVQSDRRLKTNIADSSIGLEAILALAPKTFHRLSRPEEEELGLIAQDVMVVLPQAVSTCELAPEDANMGIYFSVITTALIGAVKELAARVKTLEDLK